MPAQQRAQRTFNLTITAEDSSEEPLTGLRIELKNGKRAFDPKFTDGDGEAMFEGLVPAAYKIFANGEDTGEEVDIDRRNEELLLVYDGDYEPATKVSDEEDESASAVADEEEGDDDPIVGDEDLDTDKREEELDFD